MEKNLFKDEQMKKQHDWLKNMKHVTNFVITK